MWYTYNEEKFSEAGEFDEVILYSYIEFDIDLGCYNFAWGLRCSKN